jgi:hypothetical protein
MTASPRSRILLYRGSAEGLLGGSALEILRRSQGSCDDADADDGDITEEAGVNGLSRLDPEPRVGGAAKGFSCVKDGRRADGGGRLRSWLKFAEKDSGGGARVLELGGLAEKFSAGICVMIGGGLDREMLLRRLLPVRVGPNGRAVEVTLS